MAVPRQSAPVSPPPMMTTSFAGRENFDFRIECVAEAAPVLLRQKFHREMNALQFASGNFEIARMFRSTRQHNRVKFALQVFDRNIACPLSRSVTNFTPSADICSRRRSMMSFSSLNSECRSAASRRCGRLFRTQSPRGQRGTIAVPLRGLRALSPTTATFLPVRIFWRLGPNPAFLESALDDVFFDLLDRHRRLIDAEHARGFAGRGTNSSGKFREIVGGVQLADGLFPASAINQIIPVRNEIVDRASGVAERHAAIHAARALLVAASLQENR